MPLESEPRPSFPSLPLRDGIVPIPVDGEVLFLDRARGIVVRLDETATAALGEPDGPRSDVVAALGQLEVVNTDRHVERRDVLLAVGLGISVLALPSAAAAVSASDPAAAEPFALATGSVASFDPSAFGTVNAIAVQTDGAIVIGGGFTSVGGVTRNRIARIHPNGQVDANFNPNVGGTVNALALHSDGRIVLGGVFTNVGGQTRNRLARVDADGSLDALDVPLNNTVNAIAIQALDDDEAIVATGAFSLNIGSTVVRRLVRVQSNGTPDAAWTGIGPAFDGWSVLVDDDGGVIVGHSGGDNGFWHGPASTDRYAGRAGIARIAPNDTVDTSFPYLDSNSAGVNSAVRALARDSSGRLYLGGTFQTRFNNGPDRQWVARLDTNGAPDATFAPTLNGSVLAIAIQSDSRAVIGGTFTTVDGQTRNRIARLHADTAGTSYLDGTFDPNANGQVNALAMQTNGRILVGGSFTNIGGQTRARVARLD